MSKAWPNCQFEIDSWMETSFIREFHLSVHRSHQNDFINNHFILISGTKEPTYKVKAMSKISNKPESLPLSFNAVYENNWAGYITPIHDQGWCGSSWAISTATVASDRFGIHTKGKEDVNLSPQQLLSCVRKQSGCSGGHLDWAWNYVRKIG